MSTLSRNEEVARLYEEGASETELGRRYHCHHGVIRGWLEDLGVHIRTRSEAMTLVAERKMLENVPAGMARCACGLLMPAGAEQCDICAAGEHETERQAVAIHRRTERDRRQAGAGRRHAPGTRKGARGAWVK